MDRLPHSAPPRDAETPAARQWTGVALLFVAALAGCGGGGADTAAPVAVDRLTWGRSLAVGGTGDHTMPIGSAPEPVDAASRTRAGLYLTPSGAEQLERTRPGEVLVVVLPCCRGDDLDVGLAVAVGLQAALDLDRHAPVVLRGADPRTAASLADRMGAEGHTQVWVVVDKP